ncbi:MAG TPA: hypothetical protein PK645_04940 [Bacillota bacterium]|jgi:hypothetical protein|nr:hypothetical protein [Bacillota bacterium]
MTEGTVGRNRNDGKDNEEKKEEKEKKISVKVYPDHRVRNRYLLFLDISSV